MTHRDSFPNPERPERWPGEEDHFRSEFTIGDTVRGEYDTLGVIVAFNNTWSHIRGGRLVHLTNVGPGYGTENIEWENHLRVAEPSDRFGRHPHFADCQCGHTPDREFSIWTPAPASWQMPDEPAWHPVLAIVA
jgi:hypothetical protein